MLQLKVLVSELFSIDALATCAIALGKVSTLTHKAWNHAMERRALEAKSVLASAQLTEVFYVCRFGLHNNVTTKISCDIRKEPKIHVKPHKHNRTTHLQFWEPHQHEAVTGNKSTINTCLHNIGWPKLQTKTKNPFNTSITILPAGFPPIVISKKTLGFAILIR